MASKRLNWLMPSTGILMKAFDPVLADLIQKTNMDKSVISFWQVVYRIVAHKLDLNVWPNNCVDFLRILQPVLSISARKQFESNFEEFDSWVHYRLSDQFIARGSMKYWLSLLCDAVIVVASTQDRSMFTSSHSSEADRVFSSGQSVASMSPVMSSSGRKGIPQLDSPSDFFGPVEERNKIVQIHLEGPDLITAWMNNLTIVDPRRMANLSKLDQLSLGIGQAPAQLNSTTYTGGQFVFHGTNAHFDDAPKWPDLWYGSSVNLQGHNDGTQMNPRGVPAIYTGFSSLRCFLWAAFLGTAYKKIPDAANIRHMNSQWAARGNPFRGVAVFVFEPPGSGQQYTSFTLPPNKAQPFHAQVKHMINTFWDPKDAWKALRSHHESQTDSWPDILHCAEHGEQASTLRGFSINKWRSVWAGKGMEALNSSYLFTMAITFRITSPPPTTLLSQASQPNLPPPKKDDDQDKGKGKEKGKFNTFSRKLGKKVSAIFQPKKGERS